MNNQPIINDLLSEGLFPRPYNGNVDICLETIGGSTGFGVSGSTSDIDLIAVCVPPMAMVFPHTTGQIPGFGQPQTGFQQTQHHHMHFEDKEYDAALYGITSFFNLCAGGSPFTLDPLYVAWNCVSYIDEVGMILRVIRDDFLGRKGCYDRFTGIARSQYKKLKESKPADNRLHLIEKFGFDTKRGYHVVRLLLEVEQIMTHRTIIFQDNVQSLQAVRDGDYSLAEYDQWVGYKFKELELLYKQSRVPEFPDYKNLNRLLRICLEAKYGKLTNIGFPND